MSYRAILLAFVFLIGSNPSVAQQVISCGGGHPKAVKEAKRLNGRINWRSAYYEVSERNYCYEYTIKIIGTPPKELVQWKIAGMPNSNWVDTLTWSYTLRMPPEEKTGTLEYSPLGRSITTSVWRPKGGYELGRAEATYQMRVVGLVYSGSRRVRINIALTSSYEATRGAFGAKYTYNYLIRNRAKNINVDWRAAYASNPYMLARLPMKSRIIIPMKGFDVRAMPREVTVSPPRLNIGLLTLMTSGWRSVKILQLQTFAFVPQ